MKNQLRNIPQGKLFRLGTKTFKMITKSSCGKYHCLNMEDSSEILINGFFEVRERQYFTNWK